MIKTRIFLILILAITTSCAHKVDVGAPAIVRTERFSYVKDDQGRWFVVTTNAKDLDEAMKFIRPGPASVDKVDLWIITPLGPRKP